MAAITTAPERAARALSLTAGLAVFAVLSLAPMIFGRNLNASAHAGVGLLALGASAACVHGFGLRPERGLLGLAFSPMVAWALLGLGLCLALA